MQKDMHYYGAYAMALAAGIPARDASVIAYSSQFVDDSTRYDSGKHADGGLLFGITTSHHPAQSLIDNATDHGESNEEQRRIWVPFHFFPGGEGASFHEKILCVKDGPLVNEMLKNHIEHGGTKAFALELIGIAAHVYMDTFSHYGFSGMSSELNKVKFDSIKCVSRIDKSVYKYIKGKFECFVGTLAEAGAEGLGHAGAATFPDRPYLHWELEFERPRPGNGVKSDRNNPQTYLEGCAKLHSFFCKFARSRYAEASSRQKQFSSIEPEVKEILAVEGKGPERCAVWENSSLTTGAPNYDPTTWENEKRKMFELTALSSDNINTNAYKFHQAAAYHRYYVLKDLLPSYGIAVY